MHAISRSSQISLVFSLLMVKNVLPVACMNAYLWAIYEILLSPLEDKL